MEPLTKSEWIQETMSDLSDKTLEELWNAIDQGDLMYLGRLMNVLLYPAVENYYNNRKDEALEDAKVDDEIDRRQMGNE